jgi:cardiolipin synthase
MHPNTFTVLTPLEFIDDVKQKAKQATRRVWGQAMDVEPGDISNTFFHIFQDSAEKGIDTRFHADYYSLMVTEGFFNYWPFVSPRRRRKRKQLQAAIRKLESDFLASGVKFLYINPPSALDRVFPVRGRNHMKIVVTDQTAWIGGVNFTNDSFKVADLMIRITDPQIVSEIAYVYEQIDRREALRDMAIDCTPDTKILVDCGRINHSIILRHTVEMVDSAAKYVQVVSPLIPDADLLLALKRALKRGVTVEVIAPQSIRMSGIYVILDEFNGFMMRLKGGHLPIRFKPRMIHAKILIVDEREAIVGSHNLSSRGVRMGTEEIALRSTDPTLVTQLQSFYHSLATL